MIETPIGALRIYSLHLDHVSPDERITQIAYLRDRARGFVAESGAMTGGAEIGLTDPPLLESYVMMGDFNMEPETPEYAACVGLRDIVYDRGGGFDTPIDAIGWHRSDRYSRIDSKNPDRHMHLDYRFISCGLLGRLKSAWVDTKAEGSDHFPVWIEIE